MEQLGRYSQAAWAVADAGWRDVRARLVGPWHRRGPAKECAQAPERHSPHLTAFATGLRRDHAAVTAGLTLPHSSGAVEGTVNKIKFLKRQMFGRANFDLAGAE